MNQVNILVLLLLLSSLQCMFMNGVNGEDNTVVTCEVGYGFEYARVSGTCTHEITTKDECEAASEYNRKNNIDKNGGFYTTDTSFWSPPGCFQNNIETLIYYNNIIVRVIYMMSC